uniref:RRM domain-containing protein n=1 Tax=Syphacia muris TaxID=451379 RepID=A0A0N5ARZ4_9BILA
MDNYYRGSSRFDRINQDEVPKSKHTIFIRGLPGYIRTDEVKDFFEDHIGPCSFDFVKISPDQLKLFVAVRFETREAAKECMSKYRDSEVLGHAVELTWFKDIRRYVSYQQSQGYFRFFRCFYFYFTCFCDRMACSVFFFAAFLALKSDCETFAFVVKMIVQKEPELEGRLRIALGEIIKDMEEKFYGKIDDYLDQSIKLLELV